MSTKFQIKRGLKQDLPLEDKDGVLLYAEDTGELFIANKNEIILLNRNNEIDSGYFRDPEIYNRVDGGEF